MITVHLQKARGNFIRCVRPVPVKQRVKMKSVAAIAALPRLYAFLDIERCIELEWL